MRRDIADGPFRSFANAVKFDFPGGFGARTADQFDFADQLVLTREPDITRPRRSPAGNSREIARARATRVPVDQCVDWSSTPASPVRLPSRA